MMLLRTLTVAAIVAMPMAPAHSADFVSQLFQSGQGGCDSGVASKLTEAIRGAIDSEVKRAEAVLKMPAGISGLGCLDDLFSINLDTMISLPNLQGLLKNAISNAESQICSMAQEQWAKVTEPLTAALQIPSFDKLGIPGFNGSSTQIQFTTPTIGFGSQGGSPSFYEREDLGAGTTLRENYERIYGGNGQ
ncbi:hypothetical protein [Aureimonas sp. AU12]|uniref:hypothetical protein n=1 Tax=Aureimonas sp. AU12 TaxID=1638161 RepID=UPI0007854BD3|nr:hypothetical protein [Aureimonas sp. AU12]